MRDSTISRADLRIHAALDQFARAHLDVEGELLIDFPIDRDTP